MVEESAPAARRPLRDVGAAALAATFAAVAFLIGGSGFATDDYVHLLQGLTRRLGDNLLPREYISVPLLHYTHGLAYYLIGDRPWGYDLLKTAYAFLGVYFAGRFFAFFVPPRRALLLGFLFIFLPFHDAATYSLTHQYLIVSFSCLLFAYVQGASGRFGLAATFALIGSFTSYGSPPIVFGLAGLALMQGRKKLALAIVGPNVLYVAYYLASSLVLRVGTQRLTGPLDLATLGKQFALQLATFADAAFGPSGWSKLFYSIASLEAVTLALGLGFLAVAMRWVATEPDARAPPRLVAAAALVLLGAFGMFALTGLYPQLAFSLGDRVMIYGDFLLVCLLAAVRLPRPAAAVVVVVLGLAIAGIADHWKSWHRQTERVAANIWGNEALRRLPPGSVLFVSGHQYSRLGPYCHIDFFTADYVVQTFFKLQIGDDRGLALHSFNRRLEYRDGSLLDRKYGDRHPVDSMAWVYDTERDRLDAVPVGELSARLSTLPDETRHWTQRLGDGWIRDRLMDAVPRLRYAY